MRVRIPGWVLPDRLHIRAYSGTSGRNEPIYADEVSVRATVRPSTRLLVGPNGQQRQAAFVARIRPEVGPIPVESRVTWDGVGFRVLSAGAIPSEARPSYRELVLG